MMKILYLIKLCKISNEFCVFLDLDFSFKKKGGGGGEGRRTEMERGLKEGWQGHGQGSSIVL